MDGAIGFLLFLGVLAVIVRFMRTLWRQDERRRTRPHPDREQGGGSFGDTTHWGGTGRPGS